MAAETMATPEEVEEFVQNEEAKRVARNELDAIVNPLTEFLSKCDEKQRHEICKALENGLNAEQMSYIMDPELSWQQMREIRLGFEEGLNAKTYADKSFSIDDMRAVHNGLKSGISADELRKYTNPTYDAQKSYDAPKEARTFKDEAEREEYMRSEVKKSKESIHLDKYTSPHYNIPDKGAKKPKETELEL